MKITGTVPTPYSNPKRPPFDVHPSTDHRGNKKPRKLGASGRKVSVTTHSEHVADGLVKVFERVYDGVWREDDCPTVQLGKWPDCSAGGLTDE